MTRKWNYLFDFIQLVINIQLIILTFWIRRRTHIFIINSLVGKFMMEERKSVESCLTRYFLLSLWDLKSTQKRCWFIITAQRYCSSILLWSETFPSSLTITIRKKLEFLSRLVLIAIRWLEGKSSNENILIYFQARLVKGTI